jgi:alkaline phosphatase D
LPEPPSPFTGMAHDLPMDPHSNGAFRAAGSSVDRRRFLAQLGAGAGTAIAVGLAPITGHAAGADGRRTRFARNPFTLGVASGDPTERGIVLWTRLAPEPADPMALGADRIPVSWRVSGDASMRRTVASGRVRATPELAHSVHVEVDGLRAGADYFYQFSAGQEVSPIGHFRTAPRRHSTAAELKFAVATCQAWPSGFYTPYRDMITRDLDMVLHLGDYIYEYEIGDTARGEVPSGFAAETVDLNTYRLRHTLHKLDPDLQAAHAAFPFVIVWDDHEVQNDYSGVAPEYGLPSPEFAARRAAAYQAFYEHTPIRVSTLSKTWDELRIYRRLRWGRLAEITMLDDRQYRTDNPCGDGESLRCDDAFSQDVTMLGRKQERWVERGFARSDARWNIVGQQLLLAELEHLPYEDERYWNDAWDGYPGARQRLLQSAVGCQVDNPVFFTGDWHSTFVNDLKLDFKDQAAPAVATEFVTPAITTGGDGTPYGPYYSPMVPFNPHIRYYEGDRRGYMAATVTAEAMTVELRFVTSVEDPNGQAFTERSFVVEAGQPGAIV